MGARWGKGGRTRQHILEQVVRVLTATLEGPVMLSQLYDDPEPVWAARRPTRGSS